MTAQTGDRKQPAHTCFGDKKYGGLTHALSLMSEICGPHNLKVQKPGAVRFQFYRHTLKATSTTIGRIRYGTDVVVDIEDLADSYSISLPIHGSQYLEQNREILSSDSSTGVIISPTQPARLFINGNCNKILVRISRQIMEQHLSAMLSQPVSDPIVFNAIIPAGQSATGSWWRTISHIESELQLSNGFFDPVLVNPGIEHALIKSILLHQPHNYSHLLKQVTAPSVPRYLQQAEHFIRNNSEQAISIEMLEQITNTSRYKLYSGFRQFFGEPPTAYLKRLRLEKAREDIMCGCHDTNITSIALNRGFSHLGRFSAAYKKQFSETPSETLKKQKALTGVHYRTHHAD